MPSPMPEMGSMVINRAGELKMLDENGEIRVSNVFDRLYTAWQKVIYNVFVLEGGSRSSKTISIIQFLLLYAQLTQGTEKRVIISRAVGTWIKGTVLHDFLKVVKAYGWYDKRHYNKTDRVYKLFDCEFWFLGLDDDQRLHGMTCDVFWINEAMEAGKNDFDQLEQRCAEFAIIDYNPTEEEHWIYENVCGRDDAMYIHSTMLDNPFLPANMRRKILSYKPTKENFRQGTADKNKWEIYGLGKRARIEGVVFENYEIVDEVPAWIKRVCQGLDLGYTHDPTAILDVWMDTGHNALYLDELCYRTHMLSRDIVAELKTVNKKRKIISESADPRMVDEIALGGFNIHAVEKGPGSIKAGIDKMKGMKIYITRRSMNLIKEFKNYKYKKDKNGKWLNEPIDDFNHGIDAARYVVLMELLGRATKRKKYTGIFH
ncbi:PBSX family phage terminase large subunit [Chitinophaga niabensis]|uniref:PBSX family phage terminase large subunit n=1 Tax=Chitinophaga niabensis TaxID=536979 RepID=UPI0031BB0435